MVPVGYCEQWYRTTLSKGNLGEPNRQPINLPLVLELLGFGPETTSLSTWTIMKARSKLVRRVQSNAFRFRWTADSRDIFNYVCAGILLGTLSYHSASLQPEGLMSCAGSRWSLPEFCLDFRILRIIVCSRRTLFIVRGISHEIFRPTCLHSIIYHNMILLWNVTLCLLSGYLCRARLPIVEQNSWQQSRVAM